MAGANYEYCDFCETKALYVGEDDVPDGVEVVHTKCLQNDYAAREKALREQIAAEIEAYQPTAHMAVCPPAIAWEAGRETAASIARHGARRGAE